MNECNIVCKCVFVSGFTPKFSRILVKVLSRNTTQLTCISTAHESFSEDAMFVRCRSRFSVKREGGIGIGRVTLHMMFTSYTCFQQSINQVGSSRKNGAELQPDSVCLQRAACLQLAATSSLLCCFSSFVIEKKPNRQKNKQTVCATYERMTDRC